MKFVQLYYKVKQTKTNLQKYVHCAPLLLKPTFMRMYNAESQKRSSQGSKFKEDDRALHLF